MKPQIDVITLAVENLERSLTFYRDGLGLPTSGIVATEYAGGEDQAAGAIALFKLSGGLRLALYPRTEFVKDAHVESGPPNSAEFSLAYIAESKEEADRILQVAEEAGAVLTDAAHERPWGIYSGYFTDPDGHLWEVIWDHSPR